MDIKRKKEIINRFKELKFVEVLALKLSKDLNMEYKQVYEMLSQNIENKIEKDLNSLSRDKNFTLEKSNKSVEDFISEKPVIKG